MGVLQPNSRCKWCKAIKGNRQLLKRIYASKHYTGKGESLRSIAANNPEMGSYRSLLNHCDLHQALTDAELSTRQLEKVAKQTSQAIIKTNVTSGGARQDALNRLSAEFEHVDMSQMKPKDIFDLALKAAKHADDVRAKEKDQTIDIMKHMASVRSGEVFTESGEPVLFDPWQGRALPNQQNATD